MTTIRNWLGNVTAEVEAVLRPTSVPQLQEIVGTTRGRLVVLGRRMSKTPVIAAQGGRALDMTELDAVLDVGEGHVRVQAGINLYSLLRALYPLGRQLPGFTMTANVSVGGTICAPTKGNNHPFIRGANSVSSAMQSVKVVRPSGELVELQTGTHDRELALLKDSYGTVGIVAEATLRTVPLMVADVREQVLPIHRFQLDQSEHARALDNRIVLFPKLGWALIRDHFDARPASPTRPFEELIDDASYPYVKLAGLLPRPMRRTILTAAVWAGVDRRLQPRYHLQNLSLYPENAGRYLDFIQWGVPVRQFEPMLIEVVAFCRSHPGFPPESLVELYRMNAENRFFDSDDRVAFDPVCFVPDPSGAWEAFYRDYNRFMVERRATPYLNQTRYLDPDDLRRIYGARYGAWRDAILAVDPERKLGSSYLDHLLEIE